MKLFACIATFACVASLSSGAVIASNGNALSERDAATDEYALVSSTYQSVLSYDADISVSSQP